MAGRFGWKGSAVGRDDGWGGGCGVVDCPQKCRAVRWLMQRAALGFAACSAGRCSVLRFLPLSCGLAGGEDCRSLFFLSHKRNAARWIPSRSISCFRPYGRVCSRLWGVSGVSLRSLTGSRCFSPGRRHPFRRGIRWRGGNPASARSGACCSSRCGLWSRARGCLHPHRSG